MNLKQYEQDFYEFIRKIDAYREAISLIEWDLRTGAPKKGIDKRSEVLSILSGESFTMTTGQEMETYLQTLTDPNISNQLSTTTQKIVDECKREYDKMSKIPASEYTEYVKLRSKAESVWEEARALSDFELFQPYLEKIVETNKRFIEYWGYESNPYNTLLDQFEPGMTTEVLDQVFAQVRHELVPLVKKIGESANQPETGYLYESFPTDAQKDFSLEIVEELGYDFDAGRLDQTVHPFQTTINAYDTRITTRYDENDFRMAVFGTIHETGHAVYEQNIDKDLEGTPLYSGTSMGIHESQSLFFENFLGRNKSFWIRNYPKLQQYSSQFNGVDLEDFYHAINEAKPSLIRIEADELTYCLHIMIRYELEKALINGKLTVADLPQKWNEKYQQYLGIMPDSNSKGVLQDVHWAAGLFGYFPSYALGYMYAAQFKNAMLKDIPNFDELLARGDVSSILEWLHTHIHYYGKTKKPLEIIHETTGEALNPHYLIDYLVKKYSSIYHLS